jgi:hypothetical protein
MNERKRAEYRPLESPIVQFFIRVASAVKEFQVYGHM